MAEEQGNIRQEYNNATVGLNMDQSVNQLGKGKVSYALNAAIENFDANSASYQNEEGNEFCLEFPEGYVVIGKHFIIEQSKHIFFLANSITGDSQIGYMDNNDCIYHTLISAICLNFNVNYPIHKVVHRITNCSTEIYWTDGLNPRRYLNIDDIPKTLQPNSDLCDPAETEYVDCNQLKLQPDFAIPQLHVEEVVSGGNLTAGAYQFAAQYSDVQGNPYTSYYSITNPTPIADNTITSVNFNYPVGKSIVVQIDNLDGTGQFQYFNLAVIKTINAISSVELVGTYYIDSTTKHITYSGQDAAAIRLSINDIFEKFPYYDIAQDVTAVQDVLVWDNLTSIDRVNYQHIANKIHLQWETWRIPADEDYSDEWNATNLRGQLRDEVYPYEIAFLLTSGKQTDGFHIPGRMKSIVENSLPDVDNTNDDFIGEGTSAPYWRIYNTASVTGTSSLYNTSSSYKGPYQYGEFAYWESEELYPCNDDVWGELSGQPIRHHKFPDVLVSPIFESEVYSVSGTLSPVMKNEAIYPIGVKVDIDQIKILISSSSLTSEQKADIIGFKILRGDRATNKSIVAKGILRNVGSYEREGNTYYYPNYPYNDLSPDPFLNQTNNAYSLMCEAYEVEITSFGLQGYAEIEYTDCETNDRVTDTINVLGTKEYCSITKPVIINDAIGEIGLANYEEWTVTPKCYILGTGIQIPCLVGFYIRWNDYKVGDRREWLNANETAHLRAVINSGGPVYDGGIEGTENNFHRTLTSTHISQNQCSVPPDPLSITDKSRQIFNSPETSFGQPFLGDVLKLESVIFGGGKAHFTEVKDNAKYKLLTKEAQIDAIDKANALGILTDNFDSAAFFTSYESYLTIYVNGMNRKNFAYSFNSIADYNYSAPIPNDEGIKQRNLDIARYLIPGVISTGDDYDINNYQRESSVYLKTEKDFEYPSTPNNILVDNSRFTASERGLCDTPDKKEDISVVSYYASIKNNIVNQWGQIYSYETIDTGFQSLLTASGTATVFGGDTFICRFAFKTKLPFFIDNRVNAPDDSDIFYDEIGNVAYPVYWHSARSITKDYVVGYDPSYLLSNIISYKAHNFDCPNDQTVSKDNPNRISYDGYFYLFAYGVPNFYCESSYNVDLRQAFNNREGDFWPHVSSSIPDDWVQESFVSIANDNTYTYNSTYSKQNKENLFTHLPIDWDKPCYTEYPFRAIYSDAQNIDSDNRINSWLIYRGVSYFDFPQNYGSLTSLDGIQNRAILARFENKSLLYNNLLTMDTSNPQAAYLGNPNMFKGAPPIDFAETDLGYVGSQHKMLLKIPQGQITIDAKRGQVFLINGTQAIDLSAFGSGMNRFLTDHLSFKILDYFPELNVDNHFNGIGLHAVYDSKYERVIITKLDYIPIEGSDITYEDSLFYLQEGEETKQIHLTDTTHFCNKSWTLSFNFNTKSWISFHSYLPNFYIGENNFFYSGMNDCCDDFEFIVGVPADETECYLRNAVAIITTPPQPDCRLIAASIQILPNCELEATAIISDVCDLTEATAIVTVPPQCERPEGLIQYEFITGYTDNEVPITILSTGTKEEACEAVAFINESDLEIGWIALNTIQAETTGITLYADVYAGHGGTDCECIPDGWYFTTSTLPLNTVFHVVDCQIVAIEDCTSTTTSTTTDVPNCLLEEATADVQEFPETCDYDGGTAYIISDCDLVEGEVVEQATTTTTTTEVPLTTTTTTTTELPVTTTTTSTTEEPVTTTTSTTTEEATTTTTTTSEDPSLLFAIWTEDGSDYYWTEDLSDYYVSETYII
jgi:hypothetical protein